MKAAAARRRWSLSSKFSFLTGSLIISISGLVLFSNIRSERKNSYNELLTHGLSVAAMMAQNSEYGIYTENQEALDLTTESIFKDPNISYVVILGPAGKPLASRARIAPARIPSILRTMDRPGTEIRHADYRNPIDGGRHIDILAPVSGGAVSSSDNLLVSGAKPASAPEVIGYLQIGVSLESLRLRVRQYIIQGLVFTSLFVLAGIALSIYMTARIASPVKALRTATKTISEGRMDERVVLKTQSNDEISDLSDAFNTILGRFHEYRDKAEQRTKAVFTAKARMEHLLVSSPGVVFSCQADDGYGATFVSANVIRLLGYEPDRFLNDPGFWLGLVHPDNLADLTNKLEQLNETEREAFEFRMKHDDGQYRWLRSDMKLYKDPQGDKSEILCYWLDVSAQRALQEQLQHDAFHDSLTKLPNRALFLDRLKHSFARTERQPEYTVALLFIDLDRFKNVNDIMGHMAGDQLLLAAAQRLVTCVRLGDSVARLGGDEFAVILEDIADVSDAIVVARRILEAVSKPFVIGGHEVLTSASIGISLANSRYERPEDLLRDADIAMYQAKEKGRAGFMVFQEAMRAQAFTLVQLETDLRSALDRKEFVLHYQPIMSMTANNIVGFEALLRWNHPNQGLVPPSQFIPIAEETGLIIPIGSWVLLEACRQMRSWHTAFPFDPPLTISVNVSKKQFLPRFIGQIRETLKETGLPPSSLKLELTESMIVDNSHTTVSTLDQLRKMNVQIYIDDFGTGYSSMNYLHRLPIDALKIDRSFIKMIDQDREAMEIIRAIINLAATLGLKVVAEGVETDTQAEILKRMGCEFAQGFLFSRPLDIENAQILLARQSAGAGVTPERPRPPGPEGRNDGNP